MQKSLSFSLFICLFLSSTAFAETITSKKTIDDLVKDGYSINYVVPIYSQLLAVKVPKKFHIGHENVTEKSYILEAIPNNETVQSWTQMLTISGYKGLAKNPNFKPINMVQGVANGFQKACAPSFSAKSIWQGDISGFEAFAAVITCGSSPMTKGKTSEEALVISIKGGQDFYGVQFAKRNKPSTSPIEINVAEWMLVLKSLHPIKLCERIKDEKPPYPSCINQK